MFLDKMNVYLAHAQSYAQNSWITSELVLNNVYNYCLIQIYSIFKQNLANYTSFFVGNLFLISL